jgi:hypothetical protein
MKKLITFLLFLFIFHFSYSITNNDNKESILILQFNHVAGKNILVLNENIFMNESGQSYTITKFKYYISNIKLKTQGKKDIEVNRSFLIDEEEPLTKQIELNDIPEGHYDEISFILGVDSIHNCSGIQSGDLDPVKGMFWAWNTGYIFLKFEGKSPSSNANGNIVEYHIGGFTEPYNCIRQISLKLDLNTGEKKEKTVQINADVSEILKSPFTIDFSKMPVVTDKKNATKIADNYSDMFSIDQIK